MITTTPEPARRRATRRLAARLALPAAALALFAAGCGGDDKSSDSAKQPTGEDAVKQTILDWTFKGGCDYMTENFIEDQAFIGDSTQERCAYLKKTFTKPQYSEDDVKFRKITISGDTASATIGSDIANVTSTYQLVNDGGRWKIDSAEID